MIAWSCNFCSSAKTHPLRPRSKQQIDDLPDFEGMMLRLVSVRPNNGVMQEDTTAAPSSESVFRDLIVAIVTGRYVEGTRLPPERELAKQLGTSRPTLREVLGKLSTMRVVNCLLYTSPSPRDLSTSRMPSSA